MTIEFKNNTLTLDCGQGLNSESIYELIDKIKHLGDYIIKKVCVKYAPFPIDDFKDFIDAININQSIEKLKLINIKTGIKYDEFESEYFKFGLYKNDIEILCNGLKNNKHLRKLTLVNFYIKSKNAKLLKTLFQNNRTIQYLSIFNSKVSKKINQILFDFLKNTFFCKLKLINNTFYEKEIYDFYGCKQYRSSDYLNDYKYIDDNTTYLIDISDLFY